MKKQFILAIMAATMMTLGACGNEEEVMAPAEGAQVNFTVEETVTRTTTTAAGVTSFVEGDEITLYSTGLKSDMAGTVFTVGSGGTLTSTTKYNFDGMNGASFYAYYPKSATGTATTATFTVAADQQAAGAFGESDFMTSTATVDVATTNAVNLAFTHRMTLVKVELSGVTASSVRLNGVHTTATWTYATNTMATTTDDGTTNITMGLNSEAKEYWAIIPAQTFTKGNVLVSITATDGKEYTYTPTVNNVTFNEGKSKKFKLTVSGDGTLVSLSTTMDTSWGMEELDEGNIIEVPIIPAVTASTPITSGITNRSNMALGTWGTQFNATDFAATATAIEGGFEMEVSAITSSTKSWYNRTLFYRGSKDFDPMKTYTLKFTSSSPVSGQLWITATSINSTPKDVFYQLNTTGSEAVAARIFANTTSTPTEFSITITPAKSTESSTAATAVDFKDATTKDFYIGFCTHSDVLTKYTITNITLTQN